MKTVLLFAVTAAASIAVQTQDPAAPATAFEVASIKPNKTGERAIGMFPSPGRLRVTNYTLKLLIKAAYYLKDYEVSGATGWIDTDPWDIEAKVEGRSNMKQYMLMLQPLLADRFHLRFHRETRQLAIYALVVTKGGPKLQASKDDDGKRAGWRIQPPGHNAGFTAIKMPFDQFSRLLSGELNLPVIDETGITGTYDIALEYTTPSLFDSPDATGADISVFAAIQQQLGLKLEARKGPVEVLVVDHAEKPGEN
jgi:uncharacterized protein (TIGR03435 family)